MKKKKSTLEQALKNVVEPKENYYLECYAFALNFIKQNKRFTSEDIIEKYAGRKKQPSEPRVWGAVIRELLRLDLLNHCGYSKYRNPSGHQKISNVWESKIFKRKVK